MTSLGSMSFLLNLAPKSYHRQRHLISGERKPGTNNFWIETYLQSPFVSMVKAPAVTKARVEIDEPNRSMACLEL